MALRNMEKAIFLDKDGTLIYNVPYNIHPEQVRLYEDVPDALRLLQKEGYRLIMVTNQPGVAFGYFGEEEVASLGRFLKELLGGYGVRLDAFYYCPHHEEGKVPAYTMKCSCRKPEQGLFLKAARAWNIDLSKSWMIGDILHDVEAGNRAGCRSILINNGNETEWMFNRLRVPAYMVKSFGEAAGKILQHKTEKMSVREKGGKYEGTFEKSGGGV